MNYFFFILFIYQSTKVLSQYEKIDLMYVNSYFYIPLYFPDNTSTTNFIFSTILPKSFYPSLNCSKCMEFGLNQSDYTDEDKNAIIPYYFYNFMGRLYSGNYSTKNFSGLQHFLAFDNLTYERNYSGRGRYSLSYLNYNLNTTKKIFAIKFTDEGAELHLGNIENKSNMNELKKFPVAIENKYENRTETVIKEEYRNFLGDNFLFANEDNITTENITYEVDKSCWYMNFTQLKIRKEKEEDVDNPLPIYKLTLDLSTRGFYIPRDFFIKNVQKIFPKEAKCQIARGGHFVCQCNEDYKTQFGNFEFISENGAIFYINVTDYMTYSSSITGSKCNVHILLNYDNDLFIGGTSVMNNYYTIFDVENKTLAILPRESINEKETTKFLILFGVVFVAAAVILFGGYSCYNKYVINDPTGLIIQNNNNNRNRNNNVRQIRDFERENEFQPDYEDEQNLRD